MVVNLIRVEVWVNMFILQCKAIFLQVLYVLDHDESGIPLNLLCVARVQPAIKFKDSHVGYQTMLEHSAEPMLTDLVASKVDHL